MQKPKKRFFDPFTGEAPLKPTAPLILRDRSKILIVIEFSMLRSIMKIISIKLSSLNF